MNRFNLALRRASLWTRGALQSSRRGSTMLETIIAYSLVGACAWYVIDQMTNDEGILHTLWNDALTALEGIILN